VLIIRSKLYIQHLVSSYSVGGRPVHSLREDSFVFSQPVRLHVSSTTVFITRRSKLYIQHLVSSHSVGGRPVHRLREDSSVFSQPVPLHVSSTTVLIIRRSKLYYTASSGIVTPVGGRPVHRTATYSV